MNTFNIKVSEYGIKIGENIFPSYYTWNYCNKKKIPYIIIRQKIKYSNIDYDLFTVDNGLAFKRGKSIIKYLWKIYQQYVVSASFPIDKMPLRIIGSVTDNFTVFKKDQEKMVNILMSEIEKYVNENGIINIKRKKYFDQINKLNEINYRREKYLEEISKKGNK